jgi:hypothetical protein
VRQPVAVYRSRMISSLCRTILWGASALASVFALCTDSCALTIDYFQDDAMVSSLATAGTSRSVYMASRRALGGGRSMTATKGGAGSGVSRLEIVDSTLGYTQGAHSGLGVVTWDGDSDPNTLSPQGLGGLDLTQDEGSAFELGLQFFDYPFNSPIQVIIRVYDASAANGSKYSEVSIAIDQYFDGPGSFIMSLPFSSFAVGGSGAIAAPGGATFATVTTQGPGGSVDMRRVGAISLTFNGMNNSKAPDVIVTPFRTNGRCVSTPNSLGKVLDDCSLCLEDPNVNQGKNRCGACYHGRTGYSYESNKLIDACNVCPGEMNYKFPSGSTDICGACLSGPAPYQYVDKTRSCDVLSSGCVRVAPTKEILGFEKDLLKRAGVLKQRFVDDSRRYLAKACGTDLALADQLVGDAYKLIAAKGREIFRRGVLVCDTSCVTVSFAEEVKALGPQFKLMERETRRMAKKVQQCYRKLGVTAIPTRGGAGAAGTIADVQAGLSSLLRKCEKSKICPKR